MKHSSSVSTIILSHMYCFQYGKKYIFDGLINENIVSIDRPMFGSKLKNRLEVFLIFATKLAAHTAGWKSPD